MSLVPITRLIRRPVMKAAFGGGGRGRPVLDVVRPRPDAHRIGPRGGRDILADPDSIPRGDIHELEVHAGDAGARGVAYEPRNQTARGQDRCSQVGVGGDRVVLDLPCGQGAPRQRREVNVVRPLVDHDTERATADGLVVHQEDTVARALIDEVDVDVGDSLAGTVGHHPADRERGGDGWHGHEETHDKAQERCSYLHDGASRRFYGDFLRARSRCKNLHRFLGFASFVSPDCRHAADPIEQASPESRRGMTR